MPRHPPGKSLTTTIRRLPGPTAPARPTTPTRIAVRLVEPLLRALHYDVTRAPDAALTYELEGTNQAPASSSEPIVLRVVPPGQFAWTNDSHFVALADHATTARIGIVTDGYRWQIGTWDETASSLTRIGDIDIRPAWTRQHITEATAGYIRQSARRAGIETLRDWLHPTAIHRHGRAHRTGS